MWCDSDSEEGTATQMNLCIGVSPCVTVLWLTATFLFKSTRVVPLWDVEFISSDFGTK
jgi:hypothetical protein